MKSPIVCILAAGRGTRMGKYSSFLNKALLPLRGKAILSHLIDKFPADTRFVIALGHLGQQIRAYARLAHPRVNFRFVEVQNYDGPGSGPGLSLLACETELQEPFIYLSADTLWDRELDFGAPDNWMGIASEFQPENSRYCNLKIDGERVVEILDKRKTDDPRFRAFTGLARIENTSDFWAGLKNEELISGERQVSRGFQRLAERGELLGVEIGWTDVGEFSKYKAEQSRWESFDFGKTEEALYFVNGRVVKFFADPKTTERRVKRAKENPDVFPEIVDFDNQFYAYEYVEGHNLYEESSLELFSKLLTWLEASFWLAKPNQPDRVRRACNLFYREKTESRIQSYFKKTGLVDVPTWVNGVEIPSTQDLLKQVPWDLLSEGIPSRFHGDLHFENMVYSPARGVFTLLDWRDSFAGETDFGDLYYDLAKLYGGLVMNYDFIRKNELEITETGNQVVFSLKRRESSRVYMERLKSFVLSRGFDLEKVRWITGLIFLNMAPLHEGPFDRLLYSAGRLALFEQSGNGTGRSKASFLDL